MKWALNTCAIILATATVVIASLSAHAGETFYRWTDERGNPVHSDRPPPKGVDYQVVSTGSSLVRPVEADEGAVPLEIKSRAGNDFEKTDTKKAVIEKNPEYCQRARDNLATLSKNGRIRLRNDKGEYRYIDEEEKAGERQKAVNAIEDFCE